MSRGTVYPFVLNHLLGHLNGNSRVLETGCGAALYRPHLQSRVKTYIGTDVINDHYQDAGDVDIHCSANALPLRDGAFDLVFNQGAIDYMPDLPATLKEAHRVLKPGGTLLIYTYNEEILSQIHTNCIASARPWEKDHHVFSEDTLLSEMRLSRFSARDVTGELDTWSPASHFIANVMRLTGQLKRKRRLNSIWRAYSGRKIG